MPSSLEIGFALDRRWYWMSEQKFPGNDVASPTERSKKPDLLRLASILAAADLPYAIIGGVALQVHQAEPRTTLDIDLAVKDRALLPRRALLSAGFAETGRFERSDNWRGPDQTPIQFTDDPALSGAIDRAQAIDLDQVPLRVLTVIDLLHEKLRAASDPARRRSKRIQDLADAVSLVEADPELRNVLSEREIAQLDGLPQ